MSNRTNPMPPSKDRSGRGHRMRTRVKTARGRKLSSTRWLERQLNDPYVAAAHKDGYRSRAAYKLIDLDDRFGFLKKGSCVIDLGSAPGSWAQVAAQRVGAGGRVIAVDCADMQPIVGVECVKLDFLEAGAVEKLEALLERPPDFIMSDMAAPLTGHRQTDHLRTMALVEAAADFAFHALKPGGAFCAKVFQGGTSRDLLALLRQYFDNVQHIKPKASRKESVELYVIARGFRDAAARP